MAVLVFAAWMPPALTWSAEIYRCTENGKTTLQDHPCAVPEASFAPSSPTSLSAPQSPTNVPTSIYGEWRGTVQTHGSAGGKSIPGEHSLALMILDAQPDGSFKGVAPDLGCHFLGLAALPAGLVGTLRLDVTASQCKVPEFNARYQGHIILQPHSTALFQLNAVYSQNVSNIVVTEVKGTLAR